MKKLEFDQLQPEVFFAQDWFSDFTDAYAEVLNDNIRWPAYLLETIRSTTGDDPYVVKQTLHQLGFNLPYDFIAHNYPTLASNLSQLSLYSERSGTKDYPRLISFVLGRSIDANPLYSSDYETFYDKPYGPLQVEGGDWFKTTHISLGMQLLPSDRNLAIPRGKTLKDRFMDAFYEFAPWSIVVDEFYFNVDVKANLFLSGCVFRQPKRYVDVGGGEFGLQSLRIDVTRTVSEGSVHDVRLVGLYSSGEIVHEMELTGEWTSSRPGLTSFEDGRLSIGHVSRDTDVMIYGSYGGLSASANITVTNDQDRISYLEIVGPDTVLAGESAAYTVIAHTVDGPEPTEVLIRTLSVEATVSANTLSVLELEQDTQLELTAELQLTHGVIKAMKSVTGAYRDFNVHVTHLELAGPSAIDENSIVHLDCIAHYSDGTTAVVLADWHSSSSAVHVTPEGRLTAGTTESTLVVTLTAHHQAGSVVHKAQHQVELRHRYVGVVSAEIIGDSQVIEYGSYRYTAVATFSDGSKGFVDADWTTTRFSVSEDGVLHTGYVGADPVYLTIKASIDGVLAVKDLVAVDTPVVLLNINVTGPDNVRESTGGQYRAYARYSNGRDVEIEPEWSLVGSPSWATITREGVLTFNAPKAGILEIRATYRFGERVLTQGRPVVVIPNTRIIRGLLVSGPSSVFEHQRVMLTATAVYSDGTIETVSPMWEVQSADPLNDPEPMADIVSPGLLQGRAVEEDTVVIAIARYFKETAEFELTIKPRLELSPDVPVSSRIIGPSAFDAKDVGSYAQAVVFDGCADELLVSSDWSLDVEPSVAEVSESGYVRSVNGRSVTATLTSVYECGGRIVVDSMVINIVGREDTLDYLEIEGPASVPGLTFVRYAAKLKRKTESNLEDVEAVWSVIASDGRVSVNADGSIYVMDSGEPFDFTLKATYAEEHETVTATKTISVLPDPKPVYGIGPIGIRTDELIEEYLTLELKEERVQFIELTAAGADEYMYVCYPAAWGLGEFEDQATMLIGAWDGATWPDDGGIGEVYGPLTVERTINGVTSNWYLYRTDFSGLGYYKFKLTIGV